MADDINLPELSKFSLDDLKNQDTVYRIEELADDDQYFNEPMSAREFYDALDELLSKYSRQINGTEVYGKLSLIKTKMFWQALPALEKKIKQVSLSGNVVFALRNKIDIFNNLDGYLYVFEYGVGPDKEERQIFLYSLTNNEERLGDATLVLKSNDKVPSTVKNWIKDYISYVDPNVSKGESYELTQYMYSSPNVKTLNPANKEILAKIIGIYNLLRHPKYVPIIEEPVSSSEPETEKNLAKLAPPSVPKPTPQPVSFVPIPPPSPVVAPEKTAFEIRLEQASAAASHGADLEVLKHRIEENQGTVNSKQEIVNSKQIPENKAQLAVPNVNNPINAEIKREVQTKELPGQTSQIKSSSVSAPNPEWARETKPEVSIAKPVAAPAIPSSGLRPPSPTRGEGNNVRTIEILSLQSLDDIKTLEDLKKIQLGNLHQGPMDTQIEMIKSKIINLSHTQKIWPYYLVAAFEQSPLFKAYLAHGSAKFDGKNSEGDLSQHEFEAIADLRREVEGL